MTQAAVLPEEQPLLPCRVTLFGRIATFPIAVSFALVVLTVLTVSRRFNDLDLWWHLKIGQQIWATHSIPRFDTFSYTTNHHLRTPHEWLSEWFLFGVYHFFGYTGLMAWMCVVGSGIVVSSYLLAWLYSGNAKTAFVPAMITWFFATSVFSVRPQLLGFLFLSLELLILEVARRRDGRFCYGLPLLFLVWVNCHASFSLGFAVLVLTYACASIQMHAGLVSTLNWPPAFRRDLRFAAVASLLAIFLNPVGISLVLYPFDTLFHQHSVIGNIQEWQPLTVQDGRGLGLFLLVAVLVGIVLLQKSSLYTQEIGFLAVSVWLALSHQRLTVVFGLFAAPILARLIAGAWDSYEPARDLPVANALLIALALTVTFVAFPNKAQLASQVESGNPTGAVRFIRARHLQGNMFNSFDYGGYLMWALPEHPLFIDGRADVYDWTGVMAEDAAWSNLSTDPNKLLDKYAVSFCVVERNSSAAHILSLLPLWKKVYEDGLSVIYVRSA